MSERWGWGLAKGVHRWREILQGDASVLACVIPTHIHASAEVLGSLFAMHTMDAHMGLLCTGPKQTREIEVNTTAIPPSPPPRPLVISKIPLFSAFCGEVMTIMVGKE